MFTSNYQKAENDFADSYTPNISWLDGHYDQGYINTALPQVSLFDYFWQGREAEEVIEQIHEIWVKHELTQQQAVNLWIEFNL